MTPRNRTYVQFSKKISRAAKTFSLTEKSLFFLFLGICILTVLYSVWSVNEYFLVEVPRDGGTLVEGIVGSPRFVNPLLATSDADEDLTTLVYSGLLRAAPNGTLVDDLSKEHSVSADGLEYTFTLKDNVRFHDGTPITTDDIEFTIKKVQDSALKSPKRINWDGVTIQKIDGKTIKFTLKRAYSPFIENFTLGILPAHIWKNLDADQFAASLFNTEPIGSGPFKMVKVKRNSGGLPVLYELSPFSGYALSRPHINLTLRFYQNTDEAIAAYKSGSVESINGIPPRQIEGIIKSKTTIQTSVLPRVFAVFFNQNQAPVLVNKEVRMALDVALDKERIIQEVLSGYGEVISGPLSLKIESSGTTSTNTSLPSTNEIPESRIDQAISILTKTGWILNAEGVMEKKPKGGATTTLAFSLSTGNVPELKQTAAILQEEWRKIGAHVDVKVFETSDLNQEVIRPRKYDALLFGEVTGHDFDLYPFWHSSQRNDPGLNIALYTNIKADKLLEDMRATTDRAVKEAKYLEFAKLLKDDMPVVFLYSPDFIYLVPSKVINLELGNVATPAERFVNVNQWYIETNKVWKIFNK